MSGNSVWTLKHAYPNNKNILKDHLKHAAAHSETHQDKQCNVADVVGDTRALSTSSDFVAGHAGPSATSRFSSMLLSMQVCVQNREEVPGWLSTPPGTTACLLCPSAHLKDKLWWVLQERETVSVQKYSCLVEF